MRALLWTAVVWGLVGAGTARAEETPEPARAAESQVAPQAGTAAAEATPQAADAATPAEPETEAVIVTACPDVEGLGDADREIDASAFAVALTVKVYEAIIPMRGLFCTSVTMDGASSAFVATRWTI